ncbi:MAG: glycosyl transferase family 1 [Anaerolineaceae bacterium]|nr:glycosyl transferase family 1 [Anaerolineaceae bacterium]
MAGCGCNCCFAAAGPGHPSLVQLMPYDIAIDASRTTVARVTGTEHYAHRLISGLIDLNNTLEQPHRLSLYFRDAPAGDLFPASDHTTYHVIPFPRLWTHLRFAAALVQHRPDVTFVPAHTLPFVFPGRSVVTIHDLGYLRFPQAHPTRQRAYLDLTTRYSANRASLILADSQATADDLHAFYRVNPTKIRVVYPGVDVPSAGEGLHLSAKYGIPNSYLVFIGTLQPRKNIERLIRAFTHWKRSNPDSEVGLVLAGGKGWLFDEAWLADVEGVYLTGYIDEADKGSLLRRAMGMVFPSLYEGFGFPVVEAMHVGTPVIASNTSSLPELVADAGIQIDPLDEDALISAIDLLVSHADLRQSLREKGYQQAAQFTWEQAAQQTLDALVAAASS